MVTPAQTVAKILGAGSWDQRVAQMRLVSQNHGTGEHAGIYAEVARQGYVPNLSPDFAYIHDSPFYELPYFRAAYVLAHKGTNGFTAVTASDLARVVKAEPTALLALRTLTGLTKTEFAHSTALIAAAHNIDALSDAKVMASESKGTRLSDEQAKVIGLTLTGILEGTLFAAPPTTDVRVKQKKPDTTNGWSSVRDYATHGVPLEVLLHQRHYGGAFRQVLDATSTRRGDLIEDAVEELFTREGVPHIRTGSHNQAEIADRFEVQVAPAPDFVVYDQASGNLRAMLECKLVSDGGTARDKALRFERLRAESVRLGGVPLLAVLGGMGWTRVNDTLGPVLRDTEGRVFTLSTLDEMLTVAPFPQLVGQV